MCIYYLFFFISMLPCFASEPNTKLVALEDYVVQGFFVDPLFSYIQLGNLVSQEIEEWKKTGELKRKKIEELKKKKIILNTHVERIVFVPSEFVEGVYTFEQKSLLSCPKTTTLQELEDDIKRTEGEGDFYVRPPFVFHEHKRWISRSDGMTLADFEKLHENHRTMTVALLKKEPYRIIKSSKIDETKTTTTQQPLKDKTYNLLDILDDE